MILTYHGLRVHAPPGLLLLAILAAPAGAAQAQARAEENECRRVPVLSEGPAPGLGRIVGAGRASFVKDGLARPGCPDASPACRERAYLVAGDPVILAARRGAYVCASYRGTKGNKTKDDMGVTGWLPAEAVAVEPEPPVTPEGWLGTWTRAEAQIRVKPGAAPGTLAVQGDATWGMGDPDRVSRGGIHTGEIAGTAAPTGAGLSFAMIETGAVPVAQGTESDCKVWMRRVGPWLVVDDNLACGGVNVSFRGVYRRGAS